MAQRDVLEQLVRDLIKEMGDTTESLNGRIDQKMDQLSDRVDSRLRDLSSNIDRRLDDIHISIEKSIDPINTELKEQNQRLLKNEHSISLINKIGLGMAAICSTVFAWFLDTFSFKN